MEWFAGSRGRAVGWAAVTVLAASCAAREEVTVRRDWAHVAAAMANNDVAAELVTPPGAWPNAPNTRAPNSSEPHSSEPDSSEPDAGEPDSSEPDSNAPQSSEPDSSEPGEPSAARSGPASYVRVALERHPRIRATFERWSASVSRISQARRLPDPTVSFGVFVRSMEAHIGPHLARVSLQQAFPWPTALTAGADAASERALAAQRQFEAEALDVAQLVSVAYWNLWQIRETRTIHRTHRYVVQALAESVRARVATGAATLAELQQIDLAAARIDDVVNGLGESEHSAEAAMRSAAGLGPQQEVPTPVDPIDSGVPAEPLDVITAAALEHPAIEGLGIRARASESMADSVAAQRLPSFTVGADWMLTPNVDGSGRDTVLVGLGLRIPLWQSSYADSVDAERADSRALYAEQADRRLQAVANATTLWSSLRDAHRRVDLYRTTLLPLAETAYESVLGAYVVGRGTISQALNTQQQLLDLRVELAQAQADHARQWARLEALVGRPLTPDQK